MTRSVVIRSVVSTLVLLVLLSATACMYVKWQAHHTRENAEAILQQLRQMRVGVTTDEEVRRLADSQSRFLVKGIDPFCQDKFCTYSFTYDTSVLDKLAFWRISPWRVYLTPAQGVFVADVIVKSGYLVRIRMLLTSGVIPREISANVEDNVPEISPIPTPYAYNIQPSRSSNHEWHVSVYLTPNSTVAQRDAAYSLNLECIERIGGCRDPKELLPDGH